MADLTASRVLAPVGTAGRLFAFGLDVGDDLLQRHGLLRPERRRDHQRYQSNQGSEADG